MIMDAVCSRKDALVTLFESVFGQKIQSDQIEPNRQTTIMQVPIEDLVNDSKRYATSRPLTGVNRDYDAI